MDVVQAFKDDLSIQVCAFDRLGYGHSENSGDPRDSITLSKELAILLDTASISKPFTYGCWSFGCLNAQLYAWNYPQDVRGFVMVDPMHQSLLNDTSFLYTLKAGIWSFNMLRMVSPLGVSRIAGPYGVLPPERYSCRCSY
jgi:pimeloyl-ACP methyl ester carboxylesterase